MTLGCPQGVTEKVSLISQGQMRLRGRPFFLPVFLLNALKTVGVVT